MTRPPAGVMPIVGSIGLPGASATRLAPLPRCAMIAFGGMSIADTTYSYDRPWKP